MSRMIAVVRPDLVWFLVGDIVGETCVLPDDPDGAARFHSIYLATQKTIRHAIMSGELAVRAWPLWSRVPVSVLDQMDADDAPSLGIAISDLHEWLQSTAYPIAKTPKALFEVFNRRWAALNDQPERTTITTSDGDTIEVVGAKLGQGRPRNPAKNEAYAYFGDQKHQIEAAKDLQERGEKITAENVIGELIRLSNERFPGSDTSRTTWEKNFSITPIYTALGIRQERSSERLKKNINSEKNTLTNLFRN